MISLIGLAGCCFIDSRPEVVEKGVTELPIDPKTLIGAYSMQWGENIAYLELRANRAYAARWHGCIPPADTASGDWNLDGNLVTLSVTNKSGLVPDLTGVTALKFQADWILVPTDAMTQKAYDQMGADFSYQKMSAQRRLPDGF